MKTLLFLVSVLVVVAVRSTGAVRPLVVWHGINDNCEGFANGMISKIKQRVPGLYVHCVQIGDSPSQDSRNSLFMDARKQLDQACERVNSDPNLKDGFNAFGISQGGIFLRALIERCPPSKVNNFVTFSSPHQGVFGIPSCLNAIPRALCSLAVRLLSTAAYSSFVQNLLVPAQYWHDPLKEPKYRAASTFAAIYNNERDANATFKENFLKVEKLVLVRNLDDEILVPRETAHFAYYKEGQKTEVVNFTSTRLYNDDLIGLKELFEAGKVTFQEVPGKHMAYTNSWLWSVASDFFNN